MKKLILLILVFTALAAGAQIPFPPTPSFETSPQDHYGTGLGIADINARGWGSITTRATGPSRSFPTGNRPMWITTGIFRPATSTMTAMLTLPYPYTSVRADLATRERLRSTIIRGRRWKAPHLSSPRISIHSVAHSAMPMVMATSTWPWPVPNLTGRYTITGAYSSTSTGFSAPRRAGSRMCRWAPWTLNSAISTRTASST